VKRLIIALAAVASFAFPAAAFAEPAHFDRHAPAGPPVETGVTLAERLPAIGTDVAAPDQQSPVSDGAPAPASSGSEFDWSDAGLGAGAAICLAAAAAAGATALRRRPA
jgi:hypothetical protein